MEIIISEHARFEMARRQIPEEILRGVAQNPQQMLKLRGKRSIWQSRYYDLTEGKEMLLRVVYEEKYNTFFIVTVYKTSKIDKYWKKGGLT